MERGVSGGGLQKLDLEAKRVEISSQFQNRAQDNNFLGEVSKFHSNPSKTKTMAGVAKNRVTPPPFHIGYNKNLLFS